MFVSIAFVVDASKDLYKEFHAHYLCRNNTVSSTVENLLNDSGNSNSSSNLRKILENLIVNDTGALDLQTNSCGREISVLYLLLMIGTVWLAIHLLNFTKTPYLNSAKREMMADFALPLVVIVMSFIGSYVFRDIKLSQFHYDKGALKLQVCPLTILSWKGVLGAIGLAFPLSLLFFMDQNISSAMVNCPGNKLKKGSAYHWDLLVVGVINGGLSIFGLPWIHGALPHSPLHVKALADLEERIDLGHTVHQTIVRVRETRLTSLFSHILIAFSLYLFPKPLIFIPVPVLNGMFIYMAITSLYDNQLFERILLLFTEQAAYPPSHYLRRVPQRKLHFFTMLQLIQLVCLCLLGFAPSPYMKMGFPLLLLLQLLIRNKVIPKMINEKYLDALDKPF